MKETEETFKDMKKRFDASVQEIYKRSKTTTKILTKQIYDQTVAKIKISKANNEFIPASVYREYRGREIDVISVDGVDRLIVSSTHEDPKYYVHMEEMFQIIYDTHVEQGHCGRNRMEKEINMKYKNITREMVRNFLNMCFICEQRRPAPKIKEPQINTQCSNIDRRFSRCQVNVMDMEGNQDGPFRYILIYEDHHSKFVQLRPLKSCSVKDIAASLLKIFASFGAPAIMHSENGREFAAEIVKELANQWNQIKMVHGKSQLSSLNTDILELIDMWMEKNRLRKWSKCLHFVQLMKNKCYHKAIKCTPYEAMFGSKCRIGLDSEEFSAMGKITDIETEEDLQVLVNEDRILKTKLTTNDNNYCNEGSEDHFENYFESVKQEIVSEEDETENTSHTMPPSKIIKLS